MGSELLQQAQAENYDLSQYPEHPLEGRVRKALSWIPTASKSVLDGGCSYGYGTRFFRAEGRQVCGAEIMHDSACVAQLRYPDIDFRECSLEDTPFADGQFDCITMLDSLEHVSNDVAALTEMNRLLQPGGTLIISTPHAGLFGFLDPYNYGYHFRRKLPWLYGHIYTAIQLLKHGGANPIKPNPEHEVMHRHYTLAEFRRILDASTLRGNYTIEQVFRSGLFLEGIAFNLDVLFRLLFRQKLGSLLAWPFLWISKVEYWVPFGAAAYGIMVRVRKGEAGWSAGK